MRSHRRHKEGKINNIGTDIILDDSAYAMDIEELSHEERTVYSMLSVTEDEPEQLVLVELTDNGNIIKFVQNSDSDNTIVTDVEVYGGNKRNIIDIHTHPGGTPFSPNDIWLYLKAKRVYKGACETPKGDIFMVVKTDKTPLPNLVTEADFNEKWKESLEYADSIMDTLPPSKYPERSYGDPSIAHFIIADRMLASKYHLEWYETDKDVIVDASK